VTNETENQPTYQGIIAENSRLSAENIYLKQELAWLKRMIFGQKRERFVGLEKENQLLLDLGLSESPSKKAEIEKIEYTRRKTTKPQIPPSRNPLPAHLLRKEIVIKPKEDVTNLKRIGEQISEELEFKPGRLYVNRYIRPKYARMNGEGIIIGSLPDRPIEKGIPGPGLLSHILISKFVDHLPLYRQLQQFKREKVDIAQSTINDWVRYSCELLEPLYESQVAEILKSIYLMADETPIQVLDKSKRGKTHKGYFWVYYSPLDRQVFFDYRDNRTREGPHEILKDFKGFLQTDGYNGYDELAKKTNITSVGCFAHARRKFEKSLDSDPKRSEWMLEQIKQLYKQERLAREKELSFSERFQLRQEKSVPILKDIKTWLDLQMSEVLPKSQIGKAIGYMHSFWYRLEKYVEDGRLEIDNNLVENAIRPVALGRKNYLFAGSHNGAKRAAIIYSLVSTAKLQDKEPFAYLKDILARIASYPHKKVTDLLPVNWKAPEAD
jgi:transposase